MEIIKAAQSALRVGQKKEDKSIQIGHFVLKQFKTVFWLLLCIGIVFFVAGLFETINQSLSATLGVIIADIALITFIFVVLSSEIKNGKLAISMLTGRRQITIAVTTIIIKQYLTPFMPEFVVMAESAEDIVNKLPYVIYIAAIMFNLSAIVGRDHDFKFLRFFTTATYLFTYTCFLLFVFLTYCDLVELKIRLNMLETMKNLSLVIEDLV
jgi:hypothetical protein